MELRTKFSIIALIYLASLVANVILSSWCILVYFDSAFGEFEAELARERHVEELRNLVRRQASLLEGGGAYSDISQAYSDLQAQMETKLAVLQSTEEELGPQWELVRSAALGKDQTAQRWLSQLEQGVAGPMVSADSAWFLKLDDSLGQISRMLNTDRHEEVQRAAATQSRVIAILATSAALGALLCLSGLTSMQKWVIRPIASIRQATRRISRGEFEHRLDTDSADELGALACEVNQMCSTIQDMQRRLVEQERLAAAGEMFARLAHNIRNPLASIRGLAEATAQQCSGDVETTECQRRIINTVDRFEKWLRDVQQSVSPMSLNLRAVSIADPIHSVTTALAPMLDRRRVELEVEIDPNMKPALIDAAHFEQGLAALVTNAIQASSVGQRVRIAVVPLQESNGRWQLSVQDQGPGIPPEIGDKVFLPCFTTKPDGHGLGLAMAGKVVKLHGGHLTLDSQPGRGTCFKMVFPGMSAESE